MKSLHLSRDLALPLDAATEALGIVGRRGSGKTHCGVVLVEELIGALYARRDCLALEPHYSAHVSAMTTEGLHAKSDIAAELAVRDKALAQVLEAVWSFTELDVEHTISCHADSLPEAYRRACAALDAAKTAGTPDWVSAPEKPTEQP